MGWRLTAEAAAELVFAKLLTQLPARAYLRRRNQHRLSYAIAEDSLERARAVGKVVEAVARHLPFQTRCLQQALAVQRMLRRRRLPGTLCLGVSTRREDRVAPKRGLAAHAWVCVGERIVCGGVQVDRYAVVARFPTR